MSGSFAAPPAPPPINVPPPVIPVGATPDQVASATTANLAANQAATASALQAEEAQSTAAANASAAADAANLKQQQAAAAAVKIPLTGQSNSYAPGTAPGTVGSLTPAAAGTGLLSPAGETNLASLNPQPGNSTPSPTTTVPTVAPPVETTLPDVIDLTPATPAPAVIPDIPVAAAPPVAAPPDDTPTPPPIVTADNSPPATPTPIVTADNTPVPAAPLQVTVPDSPIVDNPTNDVQSLPTAPVPTPPPIQTADTIPPAAPPSTTVPSSNNAVAVPPPIQTTADNSQPSPPAAPPATPDTSSSSGITLDANGNVIQNGQPIAGGAGTSQITQSNGQTWVQDSSSGQWFTVENGQFVPQGDATPTGGTNQTDFGSGPVVTADNNSNTPAALSPGGQAVLDSSTSMTPTPDNPDPLNGYQPASTAPVTQPITGVNNPDEQTGADNNQFGLGPVNNGSTGITANDTNNNGSDGSTISAANGNGAGNQPLAFLNSDNNTISSYDPNSGMTSVDPTQSTSPPLVSSSYDVAHTALTAASMIASEGRARAGIITDEANVRNQGKSVLGMGQSERNVLTDVTNQMGIGPAQGPANQAAALIQAEMTQQEGQPNPPGTQINDTGDTTTPASGASFSPYDASNIGAGSSTMLQHTQF